MSPPGTGVRILAGTTLLLALAAVALVARGSREASRGAASGREFQRFFRGLGLGASLDLSTSDAAFDPRVTSPSSARFEPIPAGDVFEPVADVRRVP